MASTTKLLTVQLGITRATGPSTNQQYYTKMPDGSSFGYRNTALQDSGYFAMDAVGSVAAVFDEQGATSVRYSYSPYGELRSQSSSTAQADNDLRFTGGFKVGNLYKFGARYYDPSLGRFTQMDPSGQEANPYGYAANDPINRVDPFGLFSFAFAVSVLELLFLGGDILTLYTPGDTRAGLVAAFGIACGLVVGAAVAPTVGGALVALGGCYVAGLLFDAALAESGVA